MLMKKNSFRYQLPMSIEINVFKEADSFVGIIKLLVDENELKHNSSETLICTIQTLILLVKNNILFCNGERLTLFL